jgi:4-hydroxy-tetrahydrodipicolinate reductase
MAMTVHKKNNTDKSHRNVVGEHLVSFESESEKIELLHQAKSRSIFAKGAVYAAIWGQTQKPGLYTMQDVLNLPN